MLHLFAGITSRGPLVKLDERLVKQAANKSKMCHSGPLPHHYTFGVADLNLNRRLQCILTHPDV